MNKHEEMEKIAKILNLKRVEVPLDNDEIKQTINWFELGKKSVLTDYFEKTNSLVFYTMNDEDSELMQLIQKPNKTKEEIVRSRELLTKSFQNMFK